MDGESWVSEKEKPGTPCPGLMRCIGGPRHQPAGRVPEAGGQHQAEHGELGVELLSSRSIVLRSQPSVKRTVLLFQPSPSGAIDEPESLAPIGEFISEESAEFPEEGDSWEFGGGQMEDPLPEALLFLRSRAGRGERAVDHGGIVRPLSRGEAQASLTPEGRRQKESSLGGRRGPARPKA